MVGDEGKREEEKFEFTPDREAIDYISLDQARVFALQHARDNRDFYGRYANREITWEELSAEDSDDYYRIRLGYLPDGPIRAPGVEQFIIDKTGRIDFRQIISPPLRSRHLTYGFAIVFVFVAAAAIIGLFASGALTTNESSTPLINSVAVTPDIPARIIPTDVPVTLVPDTRFTVTPAPTVTLANTPTKPPPTPTSAPINSLPTSTIPNINIGEVSFTVDLADTPEKRFQGLSGRPVLDDGTGMLFVFQEERPHTFWMKDMHFPLDMIWINAECSIADIIADVPNPPPNQKDGSLPTYSPSAPATYMLEINAGVTAASGLKTGDLMTLAGSLTGRFDC